MCQLCGYEAPDFPGSDRKVRSFLVKLGERRRKQIHRTGALKASEETLRMEWAAVEARKQTEEQPLRSALERVFSEMATATVEALREKANLKALATAATKPDITPLVVSTLIEWSRWFERIGEEAREPLRRITEEGYKTGGERIGVTLTDFTSDHPQVRSTLEDILLKTQSVSNTFREMVGNEIQRGLEEGEDIEEIVERVAEKTEEQTGYRLERTVRTAANGGFEQGQIRAYEDTGMTEMRWLSQRDGRVRSPVRGDDWNHREADGQTVEVGESFLITGRGGRSESLPHPSHPSGSPGNVINCRCSTRPVGSIRDIPQRSDAETA